MTQPLICGFVQCFNESERGNIRRCLENMRQFCDEICFYDDASTDDSVKVAREYTPHIIEGDKHCFQRELFHKQLLLEYALKLNPRWIWWQDCDEILDRKGTEGDLRQLAEHAPAEVEAYSFFLVNLWRSETFARTDGLFATEWFIRLWRVIPEMHIKAEVGLDRPSYPCHIRNPVRSSIRMLHYHFVDYKRLLWSSVGGLTREELVEAAKSHFILDQRNLQCHRVPVDWFPKENVPCDRWKKPRSVPFEEMKTWRDIPDGEDLLC